MMSDPKASVDVPSGNINENWTNAIYSVAHEGSESCRRCENTHLVQSPKYMLDIHLNVNCKLESFCSLWCLQCFVRKTEWRLSECVFLDTEGTEVKFNFRKPWETCWDVKSKTIFLWSDTLEMHVRMRWTDAVMSYGAEVILSSLFRPCPRGYIVNLFALLGHWGEDYWSSTAVGLSSCSVSGSRGLTTSQTPLDPGQRGPGRMLWCGQPDSHL